MITNANPDTCNEYYIHEIKEYLACSETLLSFTQLKHYASVLDVNNLCEVSRSILTDFLNLNNIINSSDIDLLRSYKGLTNTPLVGVVFAMRLMGFVIEPIDSGFLNLSVAPDDFFHRLNHSDIGHATELLLSLDIDDVLYIKYSGHLSSSLEMYADEVHDNDNHIPPNPRISHGIDIIYHLDKLANHFDISKLLQIFEKKLLYTNTLSLTNLIVHKLESLIKLYVERDDSEGPVRQILDSVYRVDHDFLRKCFENHYDYFAAFGPKIYAELMLRNQPDKNMSKDTYALSRRYKHHADLFDTLTRSLIPSFVTYDICFGNIISDQLKKEVISTKFFNSLLRYFDQILSQSHNGKKQFFDTCGPAIYTALILEIVNCSQSLNAIENSLNIPTEEINKRKSYLTTALEEKKKYLDMLAHYEIPSYNRRDISFVLLMATPIYMSAMKYTFDLIVSENYTKKTSLYILCQLCSVIDHMHQGQYDIIRQLMEHWPLISKLYTYIADNLQSTKRQSITRNNQSAVNQSIFISKGKMWRMQNAYPNKLANSDQLMSMYSKIMYIFDDFFNETEYLVYSPLVKSCNRLNNLLAPLNKHCSLASGQVRDKFNTKKDSNIYLFYLKFILALSRDEESLQLFECFITKEKNAMWNGFVILSRIVSAVHLERLVSTYSPKTFQLISLLKQNDNEDNIQAYIALSILLMSSARIMPSLDSGITIDECTKPGFMKLMLYVTKVKRYKQFIHFYMDIFFSQFGGDTDKEDMRELIRGLYTDDIKGLYDFFQLCIKNKLVQFVHLAFDAFEDYYHDSIHKILLDFLDTLSYAQLVSIQSYLDDGSDLSQGVNVYIGNNRYVERHDDTSCDDSKSSSHFNLSIFNQSIESNKNESLQFDMEFGLR